MLKTSCYAAMPSTLYSTKSRPSTSSTVTTSIRLNHFQFSYYPHAIPQTVQVIRLGLHHAPSFVQVFSPMVSHSDLALLDVGKLALYHIGHKAGFIQNGGRHGPEPVCCHAGMVAQAITGGTEEVKPTVCAVAVQRPRRFLFHPDNQPTIASSSAAPAGVPPDGKPLEPCSARHGQAVFRWRPGSSLVHSG
jgi:hypothetical protein